MKKFSNYSEIFLLFFSWRTILFIIAAIAPLIVTSWGNRFPYVDQLISSNLPYWVWPFGNFDGVHYLTISRIYYGANYTQTFFPVYPLLIRFLSKILFLKNNLLAGLIISNVFLIASLITFKKLLILDGEKKYLKWILLFILIYPFSFYYGSVYSESLFLFFTILSFYLARQKKWLFSGICGAVASATRLFGIFIFPALLWEYFSQKKEKVNSLNFLYLGLIPLGLLLYMAYLQYAYHDALLFWHSQPVFGAARTGSSIVLLPQVIYRYLKILLTVNINNISFWNAFLELLTFCFVFFILLLSFQKKIRIPYLIYSWLCLIIPTMTGTLSSIPRYTIIIFPIFIILGKINNKALKISLFTVFTILTIITSVLFLRGYWVS